MTCSTPSPESQEREAFRELYEAVVAWAHARFPAEFEGLPEEIEEAEDELYGAVGSLSWRLNGGTGHGEPLGDLGIEWGVWKPVKPSEETPR